MFGDLWTTDYNDVDGASEGGRIEVSVILVGNTDRTDRTTEIVHRRDGGGRVVADVVDSDGVR